MVGGLMPTVPKQRFGLNGQGWMRLDILSGSLIAAVAIRDLLDNRGYKWAKMGVKKKNWDRVDMAALGLAALFAIRGVVDTLEEYNIIFRKDQIFPGRGLVADTITKTEGRFNSF
tara:strand:- start:268 stop:612 length:345 start_codon:yes stop_codon:yes gene_type:complete